MTRMSKLTRVATIVGFLLMLAGGIVWRIGHYVLHPYRWAVLEAPVQLKEGFSITRQFTVDVECEYWLGIKLQQRTKIEPTNPLPGDDFSVDFSIRSDVGVVSKGDNSLARRGAIVGGGFTTRILSRFHAEPGRPYDLVFRMIHVHPDLAWTKSTLLIFVDPHFNQGAAVRGSVLCYIGIGVAFFGLLLSFPSFYFLWITWLKRKSAE